MAVFSAGGRNSRFDATLSDASDALNPVRVGLATGCSRESPNKPQGICKRQPRRRLSHAAGTACSRCSTICSHLHDRRATRVRVAVRSLAAAPSLPRQQCLSSFAERRLQWRRLGRALVVGHALRPAGSCLGHRAPRSALQWCAPSGSSHTAGTRRARTATRRTCDAVSGV